MDNVKAFPRLMTFATVAQKGSFTEAALHLGVSKSSVSQQISVLEAELGARLLNRTTREVSLTAVGFKLLDRCTILQDQLSLLFNDLNDATISPSGRFSITFPHSLQSEIVIPAIKQLLSEYPNLEPVLIADDKALDLVENSLDVAIHVGELPDSGYKALPVGSLVEIFCATPLYLSKNGIIPSTDELVTRHWISTAWQKAKITVTHIDSNEREDLELNVFSKCNTLSTAIEMTLNHLGIALVPDIVARPLIKSGQLTHIAKNLQGPQWPVYTVHAYQKEKPIHITRFHQIVCRRFDKM